VAVVGVREREGVGDGAPGETDGSVEGGGNEGGGSEDGGGERARAEPVGVPQPASPVTRRATKRAFVTSTI